MVKISVIIPVYNRAEAVMATLGSVAAQTSRDFELILVDNNSTDDTLDALRRRSDSMADSGLTISILECTTPGASAARNIGLAAASAQWTMFFDSDDLMRPRHIARAVEAIDANPKASLIGWNILYHEGTKASVKPFSANDLARRNIFDGSMAPQRYCIRTDLARRAGGWNESVLRWNDIEYGQRILALNPVTVFAGSEITVDVIAGEKSITGLSFATDATLLNHALDTIKTTLGAADADIVELKRAITAGLCAREDRAVGRAMLDRALSATKKRRHRLLQRVAYSYTAAGGRGGARLLLPLYH